jgi:hypothetical protein
MGQSMAMSMVTARVIWVLLAECIDGLDGLDVFHFSISCCIAEAAVPAQQRILF